MPTKEGEKKQTHKQALSSGARLKSDQHWALPHTIHLNYLHRGCNKHAMQAVINITTVLPVIISALHYLKAYRYIVLPFHTACT